MVSRKLVTFRSEDRGMATRETMERVAFLLQQERLNNETRQLPKTIDNGVISIALGNCLDHCQWLGPILHGPWQRLAAVRGRRRTARTA